MTAAKLSGATGGPDDRPPLWSIDSPPRSEEHFRSLRRKLRWGLLAAYLTPLVVLSTYFHLHYTSTQRQGINLHLRSVAENKRNTVSLFLQERVANVHSAFAFDDLSRIPSSYEMEQLLNKLRQESATFVDVGLFSHRGLLVAYAGPHRQLLGKDYSSEAWFKRLHTGARRSTISDVFLGFRDQRHFVIAASKRVDGARWTLRVSVDPDRFTSFVRASILMQDVEAFVVNRQGVLQTSAPRDAARLSGIPAPSPDTEVVELQDRGRAYLCALAWLPDVEWVLVARMPVDVALAPVQRARLALVGITLAAVLVIVVVVLRSTRRMVGKLRDQDRAKEDLQRQLFNAAKLASVGEMSAGVAHEINNPLAIIYEEAALMQDILDPEFGQEFEPEDFRERLAAIKEASIRGRSITSKLLAFARQHDDAPSLVDLNQVVERVIEMKARGFRTATIELEIDLTQGLSPVLINPNQLEQVLLNLLNNARDAISGPGRVSVRTRLEGPRVVLEVQDSGCGITAEQMERIFFPFYTTKGVGKGTGLGLSISYGIVKGAGGQIEVASQVGAGTTFSVVLPAADAAAHHAGADETGGEQDAGPHARIG